jgi:very-short-patch-repair endonuclease
MAKRPDRVGAAGTPALVAIVNRVKDWRIVQGQRWYRIPVDKAPPGLAQVRYVAFYQTRAFGPEKWAVGWYALVLGITTARRRDLLPDEPLHRRAEHEYYRIALGELVRLPRPIPSRRWRRIVFIPTTLERLLAAAELNDLYRTSPIEDRLYDALRGDGLEPERQYYVREQGRGYMLDLALLTRDRSVAVECDGEAYHSGRDKAQQDRERDNALNAAGWHVLRFSGAEIWQDPIECARVIRRALRPAHRRRR